jgi:hypothetical protein
MSEQASYDQEPSIVLAIVLIAILVAFLFFTADSLVQDSQLRDLQRRVGQLEESSKR